MMSNPIYNALGGNLGGGMPQFVRFMQTFRGQNPTAIINDMLNTGKISPEQLQQAKQQASGMMQGFEQFKNMFGF